MVIFFALNNDHELGYNSLFFTVLLNTTAWLLRSFEPLKTNEP